MANYFNIQMDMPWGRDGGVLASPRAMVEDGIIGISDGSYSDCQAFKNAPIGSIVLVRDGSEAIALVEITSTPYYDKKDEGKYVSTVFRNVDVLAWAEDYEQPRPGLFHQGTFRSNINPESEQYQYIDEWYNSL